MKIRYWGVRGSVPVPGPATMKTGGNTPCVSVELEDKTLLVLDGGTGLRGLGRHLMGREGFRAGRGRGALLFTHRHWDHIQGLPFFEPTYARGNLFDLYSPDIGRAGSPLADNLVSLQHTPVNFPVPYETIQAAYRFHPVQAESVFTVGGAQVRTVRMNHADVTLGYAILETGTGRKLAYLCDTAPWDGPLLGDGMSDAGHGKDPGRLFRERVVSAAAGADLVIHDTFFDEEGYPSRKRWGHSTPTQALATCRDAGARRLHLFHYNPDLDDAAVARLEQSARAMAGDIEVTAATEGLEVVLS